MDDFRMPRQSDFSRCNNWGIATRSNDMGVAGIASRGWQKRTMDLSIRQPHYDDEEKTEKQALFSDSGSVHHRCNASAEVVPGEERIDIGSETCVG
mmetsp:Transcript_20453/g.31979  ORF Transcript_20453/g.31979 Transcript_20453/m.31979 type:complete len:96 (-) Transcript_20453:54-341(-)